MTGLTLTQVMVRHLTDINLSVPNGDTLVIHGPSGGGKTALLRAIADMEPYGGHICLDDTEAQSMPSHQWRRTVMMVPAESQWWYSQVSAHFPTAVDATHWGLPKDIGEWPVDRLSSGQRQRLALLRALCHEPRVLLLDEPTANLDPDNQSRVEGVLAEYQRTRSATILWVTHDPHLQTRLSPRRLRIADGTAALEEAP